MLAFALLPYFILTAFHGDARWLVFVILLFHFAVRRLSALKVQTIKVMLFVWRDACGDTVGKVLILNQSVSITAMVHFE